MTLTEFLLARIAEDEAVARAATDGWWSVTAHSDGDYLIATPHGDATMYLIATSGKAADAAHLARHHPIRVLAECEAKRRIIAEYERHDAVDYMEPSYYSVPFALEHLAAVHADHPDYDESWRP